MAGALEEIMCASLHPAGMIHFQFQGSPRLEALKDGTLETSGRGAQPR